MSKPINDKSLERNRTISGWWKHKRPYGKRQASKRRRRALRSIQEEQKSE